MLAVSEIPEWWHRAYNGVRVLIKEAGSAEVMDWYEGARRRGQK